MSQMGVVAIGRNEGERLILCLESLLAQCPPETPIVYVDSGSTDGSCDAAQQRGVEVVELDLSIPFTAARARNAGLQRLLQLAPVDYVQFVDGDCEVVAGWIDRARWELDNRPDLAVVCGRRRERFPQRSIYNLLCDIEWNTPIGEAKACGGDAMMRISAVQQVGSFNPSLIAGEEPELCVRLRRQGWKILRVDAEMTLHDANMTKFSQWWKRAQRAGHAYAEGAWLHGSSPERHWAKEAKSIWVWGLVLPLLVLIALPFTLGLSLVLLLAYGVMALRIYRYMLKQGYNARSSWLYSLSCIIGKFAQLQGQLQFHITRIRGKQSRLIEYKSEI